MHLNPKPGQNPKVFKYDSGFFFKVGVTDDEMGNPISRLKDPRYWKNLKQKYTKNLTESELTQEDNLEEAIPWRYLGNAEINNSDWYSKNLEHSFLQGMQYYVMKEELGDVFALGRGLMEYTRVKKDSYRGTSMDNVAEYLEKAIEIQIRGRRQTEFKGKLFGKDIPLIRSTRGNAERPD